MAIERDADDAVEAAPWRWQHFSRGIDVYTRDPSPPSGEPFMGLYRASAYATGEWRVYPDDVSPEPVATGVAEGWNDAERMSAARGEVERQMDSGREESEK